MARSSSGSRFYFTADKKAEHSPSLITFLSSEFYLQNTRFESGRCWDRTSDLCRVKSRYYRRACSPSFRNTCKTDVSLESVCRGCSLWFVWVGVLLVYKILGAGRGSSQASFAVSVGVFPTQGQRRALAYALSRRAKSVVG